MTTVSTATFSIQFPDFYTEIRTVWESARGEHLKGEEILSFITAGLNETGFYNKYEGSSFQERFYNNCLEKRGRVTVLQDKSLPVAGHTSFVRLATSEAGYFFYFATVQISDDFCYDFTADCELTSRDTYEKIFDEVWQSLQYFGNPHEAFEVQKAGIDSFFKKLKPEVSQTQDLQLPEIRPFQIPADEKDFLEIDNVRFEWLPECTSYIAPHDRTLTVNLEARAEQYPELTHPHILNDYDDGKIYLRFSIREIYQSGVPTGVFKLEKDREPAFKCSLSKGGFHYSLHLTGVLTLADGWLGFSGYFENIMQTHAYAVNMAKKIPPELLQWTEYRFLHLEEVATAPPETVHHLQLTSPDPALLSEALSPLKNLKTLGISCSSNDQLKEIPREIKKCRQLTELALTGIAGVSSFPKWIGDLQLLQRLTFTDSQVEAIHPDVFRLPQLEYCFLSNNRLETITPALPESLKVLSLQGNRFTSLPASMAALPHLTALYLRDNPLEHLPAAFINIKRLDLEKEKKQQLLDYTYPGAGGKGTIPFNNDLFEARHDAALLQTLETAVKVAGFEEYRNGLTLLARSAVALQTTVQDDYATKGNTRFGGLPDLPPDVRHPSFTTAAGDLRYLQFIAQLNCGSISHLQHYLPRTGMLYFFITDQESMGPQVLYYDGPVSALQSAAASPVTDEDIYDDYGIFTPYQAAAAVYPAVPSFYNDEHLYKTVAPELDALEEDDTVEAFRKSLEPAGVKPVHNINGYVFKQHGSPELEAVDELRGKPEDWMVLLSVSTDNNTGFCFWDAGEIYFVIHKSDLAKRDFSNIYCGLESS